MLVCKPLIVHQQESSLSCDRLDVKSVLFHSDEELESALAAKYRSYLAALAATVSLPEQDAVRSGFCHPKISSYM